MKNIIQTLFILVIILTSTTIFAQGSINVNLEKELGEKISNALVILTDANGQQTEITPEEGENGYTFTGLQSGSYTITVEKDINPLNGVSTFDWVLLMRHILGTSLLDSPYKMLAADVTGNQLISVLDLIAIRSLILFIITDFDVDSWRFVDKDYVFPNPNNPWQETIPSGKTVNITGSEEVTVSFIGVKMGDMNNSAPGEY